MIPFSLLAVLATAQAVPQTSAAEPQPVAAASVQAPAGLSLEAAEAMALSRNPDLIKSRIQADQAEQDRITARAAVLPQLNFNASVSRSRQGASRQFVPFLGSEVDSPVVFSNNFGLGLTASQLLFDGGKWWNNLAAADLGQKAAAEAAREQELQIRYLVEQKFYELLRAQRQLMVFGEAARRSREQADFVDRLFQAGRSTQADVYAARANRDNDEINRLGQEARVELARNDLSLAVGLDPSQPLAVVAPPGLMQDPAAPPAASEAVAKALETRPSLRAAAHVLGQTEKLASAATGDYWPVLSAQASYNRNAPTVGAYTSPLDQNNTASIGLVLRWNLFSGLATQASARKQELQVVSARTDLDTARRSVAADVERAVAQLSAARAQARLATQAEATAQQGLGLARTRQQVGVGTQIEVRDAELKLTQSQLAHIGALLDGREAEAALRRAIGERS